MRIFALTLLIACGDKTEDTSNGVAPEGTTDTESNGNSTGGNSGNDGSDTNDDNDTDEGNGGDNGNGGSDNGSGEEIAPNAGAWTVSGPEFTTNTCGGGEEFPESRAMTLGVNGSTVTMLIEEAGEHTYNFNCELTGAEFTCEDIVIANPGPLSYWTLFYTHEFEGVFTDNDTFEGTYRIETTCDGSPNDCSETNLGFTTPCEQVGTMTGSFGQ